MNDLTSLSEVVSTGVSPIGSEEPTGDVRPGALNLTSLDPPLFLPAFPSHWKTYLLGRILVRKLLILDN